MIFEYYNLKKPMRIFVMLSLYFFLTGHANCQANDSIKLSLSQVDAQCYGEKKGVLTIRIEYGKAPFSYQLKNNTPETIYTGTFDKASYQVEGLDTGLYLFQITDAEGKSYKQTAHIQIPPKLEAGIISVVKEKRGKGKLMANPHGGTPPYTYEWISQEGVIANTQVVKRLVNGIYKVKIQDSNNCGPEEATIFFVENTQN